jgi:hypothetical protein
MAWTSGDEEKILEIVGLPVTAANLVLVSGCMDDLEGISPASKTAVRSLLVSYEQARDAHAAQNMDGSGRTMVKADVLEWEVDKGAGYSYSPRTEMARITGEILRYFGGCLGIGTTSAWSGVTELIRS